MRRTLFTALVAALFFGAVPAGAQDAIEPANEGWWTPSYLVDYSLIAAGAAAYVIAGELSPRERAIFGPKYDPGDPAAVFAPRHSGQIGSRYIPEGEGETVPIPVLMGVAAGIGGALALQEGALWLWSAEQGSAQEFHEVMVGYLEATALTAGNMEVAKVMFGRLRPDFQDRAARHLCNTEPPDGFDCGEYVGSPLSDDPDEAAKIFEDGRKSFWSGHSAFAFSTLTYATWVAGGRWVWGENATSTSRSLGLIAQMTFIGTAFFVAGSRVDDGRHHFSDVLVGTAVGMGLASFSYWRRFDGEGRLMRRKQPARVRLQPGPDAGLSLVLTH